MGKYADSELTWNGFDSLSFASNASRPYSVNNWKIEKEI